MSQPNEDTPTVRNPPIIFRFVSGRVNDGETQSIVRSHAMSAVRSKQRHQRRLQMERQKHKQPSNTGIDILCKCLSWKQSSTRTLIESQNQETFPINYENSSKYCIGCGGVQSWELSSLHQLNMLQHLHPAITTFAADSFDPFSSMVEVSQYLNSTYPQEINTIKIHAINFYSPGQIKSVVLPEALRTPALLSSMLYMTYACLSSVRGWSNPELAIGLKTAAISHINRKLSHSSTAMCTNTIASIAYLSAGTWTFGNAPEEVEAHTAGLELLVKQRGFESLGVYKFGQTICKYLIIHQILLAGINVRPISPIFEFGLENMIAHDTGSATNLESPIYCPLDTLDPLRRSKYCSEETLQILYSAKTLIDLLMDDYETGTENREFYTEVFFISSQLKSHLSASDHYSTSFHDWIFESCRITALIILAAVETALPLMETDPALTESLVQALEKTDIGSNWGDMLGVLYWVSMIGSACSKGRPDHRLLASTLSRTMFEVTFTVPDFDCAINPARRFATMQLAFGKRALSRFPTYSSL